MESQEVLDLYEKSNNDIAVELGRRFKNYRIALRLTQRDVAEQSGVSVMTVSRFEKGESGSIHLDNLIALLRAVQKLDCIAGAIPEIPGSLYDSGVAYGRSRQRVRRSKDEK